MQQEKEDFLSLLLCFEAKLAAMPGWKEYSDFMEDGQETFPFLTASHPCSCTQWLITGKSSVPILLATYSREKIAIEAVLFLSTYSQDGDGQHRIALRKGINHGEKCAIASQC